MNESALPEMGQTEKCAASAVLNRVKDSPLPGIFAERTLSR